MAHNLKAERAVRDLLDALGLDPQKDPELRDTPRRFAAALEDELLCGYGVNLGELLAEGSPASDASAHAHWVVVKDLSLTTVCPHHLLPALGRADVAYLPSSRLLGLGTLASLVDACSRRLILQEQLGQLITHSLIEHADARCAFVRLELRHSCLCARGPRQSAATVTTTTSAGNFRDDDLQTLQLALGVDS